MYDISRNYKELDTLDAVVLVLCQLFQRSAFVLCLIAQQTKMGRTSKSRLDEGLGTSRVSCLILMLPGDSQVYLFSRF